MKTRQMKALERFIHRQILDVIELEKILSSTYNPARDVFPEGITFWQEGRLYISAEMNYSQSCVADYYGEFRDGYAWINEKIEKRAKELGLHIEWQNPGCLAVYEA